MKKVTRNNCCAYLKPKLPSLFLTLIVLALPFAQEGSSRYSPLTLAIAYLKSGEFYSLILILFLAFFVYLVISLLVLFVAKVNGCSRYPAKNK